MNCPNCRYDPGGTGLLVLGGLFTLNEMDISVSELKQQCLEIIRRVERTGQAVTVTRRGRVVARITACHADACGDTRKPWERLRALGGRLLADPEESVVGADAFEAQR